MKIRSLIFILCFAFVPKVYSKNTNNEQRTWLGLFAKRAVTKDFNFWAETQLRHDGSNQTMNQTLNRFGLLKSLNQNQELGFLFAFVQTNQLSRNSTREYRPTLQHTFTESWSALKRFSVRSRIEFRDIEDTDAQSVRSRFLIRLSFGEKDKTQFVIWDEPFINLTREDWTGRRFFERNRLFIGSRIPLLDLNAEVGYLYQMVPRSKTFLNEHTLVAYLFF